MTGNRPTISAHLIGSWIDAECELGRALFDQAGKLWDSWRDFAHSRNAEPGTPAEFADQMEARGFEVDKLRKGDRVRIRWGLRLRAPLVDLTEGGGEKFEMAAGVRTAPALIGRVFSQLSEISKGRSDYGPA